MRLRRTSPSDRYARAAALKATSRSWWKRWVWAALLVPCVLVPVVLIGAGVRNASNDAHAGAPLNLDRFELTFDEPFDRLDVSARGPGTRWIAHTPWNGDFGDAQFIDPAPSGPFKVAGGVLQIEMRLQGERWTSGLLSASDHQSHGFLQSRGYFEVRAKLPGGPGVWPAFWLGSNAPDGSANPELDVFEYYGKFPGAYLATTHVWLRGANISGTAYKIDVPSGSLENAFHTYGVAIDDANTIFYLDRREVAREATRPEYLRPMYPMVDLAAGGGWPIEGMKNPSVMYVDYIRVYRQKRSTRQ